MPMVTPTDRRRTRSPTTTQTPPMGNSSTPHYQHQSTCSQEQNGVQQSNPLNDRLKSMQCPCSIATEMSRCRQSMKSPPILNPPNLPCLPKTPHPTQHTIHIIPAHATAQQAQNISLKAANTSARSKDRDPVEHPLNAAMHPREVLESSKGMATHIHSSHRLGHQMRQNQSATPKNPEREHGIQAGQPNIELKTCPPRIQV